MADKDIDYILKLGLDISRLKAADKEVRRTLEPSLKKLEKSERKRHTLQTKNLALKQKEISLAKRQVQIEKQIRTAEAKGAKGFTRIRRMSGQGSASSVAEAELLLKRKLLAFETRHTKETAKRKADDAALAETNKRIVETRKAAEEKVQAEKKETLALQKRINAAERAVKYYTPKKKKAVVDPDQRISYQARTTLEEKLSRGFAKDYSTNITDPETLKRIQAAQNRLASLKRELNDTKSFRTLARIRGDYAEVNREIAEAVRLQKQLNRDLQKGNQVGKKFASTAKSFALHFASAYAAVGAAREVFRVGKEFDAMQAGLLAASDSAEAAKENFTFLMDTAKRLGTDVESGVRGFNRLGVSMRGAGFASEDIKQVFSGIQEATATFQLSADKSNLVMLAMSQMASKGKISSEELVRQLSCRF